MTVVNDNTIDVEGTSLRGEVVCTVGDMVDAFKFDFYSMKEDDPKSCMEWRFRDSAGNRWTIYDWKMTFYMKREEIWDSDDMTVVFNIGGERDADPTEFKEYLKQKLEIDDNCEREGILTIRSNGDKSRTGKDGDEMVDSGRKLPISSKRTIITRSMVRNVTETSKDGET